MENRLYAQGFSFPSLNTGTWSPFVCEECTLPLICLLDKKPSSSHMKANVDFFSFGVGEGWVVVLLSVGPIPTESLLFAYI